MEKKKSCEYCRTMAYKTHACLQLRGHGDFLRLIFVRAIEKLCCQTNFGISPVILFIYFILIYVYTVNKIGRLVFWSAQ